MRKLTDVVCGVAVILASYENDMENYRILVHSLKSTSLNIGAEVNV